ncbi:MAG: NAD(P)H-dependent oxidoreductase subunit E [Bacteroidales bacterium]|nr:NAD(P)H-dependent oxidoreductase subunit E [Bacteroidales bacterium]
MKTEIVICLGSSCFSRGSKKTIQLIKDYIKNNKLEDQVYFHGNHCSGNCANGPVIKINGKEYSNISSDNIISLLNTTLKKN